MSVYIEKSRELEVLCSYDVVVVGGGAAGVAAAISIKENTTPRELNPQLVVSKLKSIRENTEPAFEIIKTVNRID